MASNFHDYNGFLLVGLDLHDGIQYLPFPFGPMKYLELNLLHPFSLGPDPNTKVHINGVWSVKDQHEPVLLWPHLPIFPNLFNLVFPLDLAFGTQSCWLPRLSVLAEGKPMTTTIVGPISMNLDCFLFTKLPTSAILQPGTVETTPSFTDWAYGIGRAVIDGIFDYLFDKMSGPSDTWDPGTATFHDYAGQFMDDLVGRYAPSWDLGIVGWGYGALDASPSSLFGGLLDALGVVPPGTEGSGLKWSDIVGDPVGALVDSNGQQTSDAGVVVNNMLQNLFPPLKRLAQETS